MYEICWSAGQNCGIGTSFENTMRVFTSVFTPKILNPAQCISRQEKP